MTRSRLSLLPVLLVGVCLALCPSVLWGLDLPSETQWDSTHGTFQIDELGRWDDLSLRTPQWVEANAKSFPCDGLVIDASCTSKDVQEIASEQSFRALRIDGVNYSKQWEDAVAALTSGIESVMLDQCNVASWTKSNLLGSRLKRLFVRFGEDDDTATFAALLRKCPNLECLYIRDLDLESYEWSSAPPLQKLRSLDIEGCYVNESVGSFLSATPTIHYLSLRGADVTPSILGQLDDCDKLERLDLSHTGIVLPGPGLSNSWLQRITHLSLAGLQELGEHSLFKTKPTNLNYLNVAGSRISSQQLQGILSLESLMYLDARYCEELDPRYNYKSDCTLVALLVSGAMAHAVPKLTTTSSLEVLGIENGELGPGRLSVLVQDAKGLRALYAPNVAGLARGDLAVLKTLGRLEEIDLSSAEVSDAILESLGVAGGLSFLKLEDARGVTPDGLSSVLSLESLRYLNVSGTGAFDAAVEQPRGYPESLEEFHASRTLVNEASVSALFRCPRLRQVVVRICPYLSKQYVDDLRGKNPHIVVSWSAKSSGVYPSDSHKRE